MHPITPPPTGPTLSASLLAQLDGEIRRLTLIRDAVVAAMGLTTAPSPTATVPPGTPARPKPVRTGKPPACASKAERQMGIARLLLAGPLQFSEIGRRLDLSNDLVSKSLTGSPWFEKVGGASKSSAPWSLTPSGRAVVTRSTLPPETNGDLRPNALLDDLFLPGAADPKPSPHPFSANGVGTAHATDPVATLDPPEWAESAVLILRLLAAGPMRFIEITGRLSLSQNSVNRQVLRLEKYGLIRKRGKKAGKGKWEITDRGREELTRLPNEDA